jgi:energy-coupling factor transporter ATP-binding protein EcfA2
MQCHLGGDLRQTLHQKVRCPHPHLRRLLIQPLGQWWLAHRDRLQFRGVRFQPGGPKVVNECLNLWQGWGVEPKPGDWGLIRQHINEVAAGNNAEFAEYVIRWIAWAIQNPAAQAEVALVLIGAKGAGKGTLVRCLQRIFGAHTFQVTSREEVIGKFNGHLQDCVLFVADEAYWGGDKRCVGRLQGMITEPWLPIERKGFDLIEVPNYLHLVMLAEPGWVIPAGLYERRYAALSVSDARMRDRAYFKALHNQIVGGGAEAMMWDLQRMDLEGWHPREIPESLLKGTALQQQQAHTLPPLEQWYLSLLQDGKVPGALIANPTSKPRRLGPSKNWTPARSAVAGVAPKSGARSIRYGCILAG